MKKGIILATVFIVMSMVLLASCDSLMMADPVTMSVKAAEAVQVEVVV